MMERVRMQQSRAWANTVVVLIVLCLFPFLQLVAQDNAKVIIQRSVEANNRDWAAVPEFDNSERVHNKDGDKTYAVTMLYGTPYQRLIAVNGHPLSPESEKEEKRKYDQAV